ncbi:MAG: hypothetical protein KatS3mg078_0321 [Deltaproteobacteria bacterium]|jgi:hypothetical protein|nr:hypothetical protein HRbin37_01940 [bacterium HR37]GIW46444.1 MAG: hypothetical protein KatS3mg078_0321 [Deltaproteobacteria bacterium]
MPEKKTFGEWLRKNAEKYLMEAAADEMRKLYPGMCAEPYREKGFSHFFWRKVFVPLYLKIPWSIRKKIILLTSYPPGKRPSWKKTMHAG